MRFRARRIGNILGVLLATVVVSLAFDIIELSLKVQQYYSGWLLTILFAILFAFYAKKRLSVIPLGSSSVWAQWHYYLGFFSLIIFLEHINFSVPAGKIELSMTVLFLLILFSGLLGLLINRFFAKRLSYLKEEILFERIPQYRERLRSEVEQLILSCVEESGSTTLSDYYMTHLADYFYGPRFFLRHLFGSSYAIERILAGIQNQMRYLNKEEVGYAMQLRSCVESKSMLDTHYALQSALKYWGVLHLPIAVVLMLFVGLHIILVYAFRGAA